MTFKFIDKENEQNIVEMLKLDSKEVFAKKKMFK
jgi:hypothetical protein